MISTTLSLSAVQSERPERSFVRFSSTNPKLAAPESRASGKNRTLRISGTKYLRVCLLCLSCMAVQALACANVLAQGVSTRATTFPAPIHLTAPNSANSFHVPDEELALNNATPEIPMIANVERDRADSALSSLLTLQAKENDLENYRPETFTQVSNYGSSYHLTMSSLLDPDIPTNIYATIPVHRPRLIDHGMDTPRCAARVPLEEGARASDPVCISGEATATKVRRPDFVLFNIRLGSFKLPVVLRGASAPLAR